MARAFSFKSYYAVSNGEPEVRRFTLPVDGFCYVRLIEKLSTFYPGVEDGTSQIGWKDSDGDFVIISSDDELSIYISEKGQSGDLLRILIIPAATSADKRNPSTEVHEGVICDSCDQCIIGFRYKCMQCLDMDMCSSCESKGFHKDHFMLRIPFNMRMGGRFAHKMGKKFEKYAKRGCRRAGRHGDNHPRENESRNFLSDLMAGLGFVDVSEEDENVAGPSGNSQQTEAGSQQPQPGQCPNQGPECGPQQGPNGMPRQGPDGPQQGPTPPGPHGPRFHHPHHRRHNQPPFNFAPFQRHAFELVSNLECVLNKFLDPSGGSPNGNSSNRTCGGREEPMDTNQNETSSRRESATETSQPTATASAQTTSTQSAPTQTPPAPFMQAPVGFMPNVPAPSVPSSTFMPPPAGFMPNGPASGVPSGIFVPSPISTDQLPQAQKEVPIPLPAPEAAPQVHLSSSPSTSEWTLLPPASDVMKNQASAPESQPETQHASQPSNPPEIPPEEVYPWNAWKYPKLPQDQTVDERIEESLKMMLSMGFNNEGDWLRQMLQAKDGDIRQVLEHLMPSRNGKTSK